MNATVHSNSAEQSLIASARGVLIAGVCTLILAIVMGAASNVPPFAETELNPGFQSTNAILWFELAHDEAEVRALLTPAQSDANLRAALDTLNYYDFPFMFAYGFLLLAMMCFARDLLRQRGAAMFSSMVFFATGLALIPMIISGDIMENLQLLKLTRYEAAQSIPFETILNLEIFTRMKWGTIFLACAHLGVSYLALGLASSESRTSTWARAPYLVLGLLFLFAVVPGAIALVSLERRALLEIAVLAMIVAWIGVLAHAGTHVFRRTERLS